MNRQIENEFYDLDKRIREQHEEIERMKIALESLASLESRLRDYIKHLESWGDFPGAKQVAHDLREIIGPRR